MNSNREELLFQLALMKATAERAAFLDRECAGDPALRTRLEALLAAHERPDAILPSQGETAPATKFADEPPDEAVGQTLGRYKLLEKVGEGGCGVVYVAEQTELVRRRVALKVIKLGMDTKQVVARFEAERQALAMMDHPNIAKVLDAGTTEGRLSSRPENGDKNVAAPIAVGRPYFVMELVRGIRITDYCDQNNLPTKERLDLFIKVCQAIQHAHQKGIIHRDIKPSNILVTLHDGVPVPKVIDFGIAKAIEGRLTDATVYTQLHQFIGTPAYMSPEQAEMSGLDIDTRSDIYSLGVLLYELLAGSTPFDAKELLASGIDAMRKTIREKEPLRPSTKLSQTLVAADVRRLKSPSSDAPRSEEEVRASSRRLLQINELITLLKGDLDWIVMKCLEKDRARRYETASGLAADLKCHLNNEPVTARPPSVGYRFQKAFRRNKLVFGAVGAVVCALVLGVVASAWQATRAKQAERKASGEAVRALQAEKIAAAKSTLAEEQRQRAEGQERVARLNAYAADMKAAQVALERDNLGQAAQLLNRYWPKAGDEDLRGVEWRYLWQASKGDELCSWQHPNMAPGAHFSSDGRLVASACFDGFIRIWEVAARKPEPVAMIERGVRDDDACVSFCFSPDGRILATVHQDGTIALIDRATWQPVRRLEIPTGESAYLFTRTCLLYSPDGRWLASGLGGGVRVWDTTTWATRFLPTASVWRFAFTPDSSALAVCVQDRTGVELWDVAATRKLREFSGLPRPVTVAVSSQADWLAAANWNGTLGLWDFNSGQMVWTNQAHRSRVYGLSFSSDGTRLVSGAFDQLICVWDTATRQKLRTLQGHWNEIWSLEF